MLSGGKHLFLYVHAQTSEAVDTVRICEPNLRETCQIAARRHLHNKLPFEWQVISYSIFLRMYKAYAVQGGPKKVSHYI